MASRMNLHGQTFSRWTVIGLAEPHAEADGRLRVFWLCQCSCGTVKAVSAKLLRNGDSQSCGCFKSEAIRKARTIHGMSTAMEYQSWAHLKSRCLDPDNLGYTDYGGRGIQVCQRYQDSLEAFAQDVGPRPSHQHSIDRINNNGHYSCGQCEQCLTQGWPMNLHWATMAQQNRNRRQTRLLTHNGETLCIKDWWKKVTIQISYPAFRERIVLYGYSLERAMTEPVDPKHLMRH
jgi:hypothetical protein